LFYAEEMVFVYDDDEAQTWDNTPEGKAGWRQTMVPWAHILAVTGDQDS
jgi:hypothetical protein